MDKQSAIAQMQYFARIFDEDSNFSNTERDQLAALALQGGLTPEEAQQYSDGMVPPTYYANYQASQGSSNQNSVQTPSTPAPTPSPAVQPANSGIQDILNTSVLPVTDVSGSSPLTVSPVAIGNVANSPATPSNLQAPVVTTPTPLYTPNDLGSNFFGNNPGALGFNDLNPIVTGAENTQQTAIPEFLKPFLASSADYSQGALDSLGQMLTQNNATTAPFNELQQEYQQRAVNLARGEGGYIQDAQEVLREVADGSDVTGLFERAQNLMEAPDVLNSLQAFGAESPINSSVTDQLTSIATDAPMLNGTAVNALESTASGDYLYGGDGFNAAVDASIRKAMPNIKSNMALQGGAGALSGGLADAAIAEVTADAFARQYGQERANQLSAANQLNNFGLSGTSQRLGAAGLLGDLSLGGRSMQQSALNSALGGFQNAGNTYSNIANQERGRQITAATQLPQVGLLGANILGDIGNMQQAQDQNQRTGNINAMQQLLNSAYGNINPNSLFGNISSVQQNENTGLKALGGAMAGNSLAGSLGIGGPWGAIGGGLLGAFG